MTDLMAPKPGEINTFLSGDRLLIVANIGLEDFDKLQKSLRRYKKILTLAQPDSATKEPVEAQP